MTKPGRQLTPLQKQQMYARKMKRQKIAKMLAAGKTTREIALQMAPHDEDKQRKLQGLARRMVAKNEEILNRHAEASMGALIEGLEPASEALARRAARGRPDAIKLLYEVSGLHNPKVQHEHSGEVKVSLSMMPRPEPVKNPAALDEPVVDATVVEEE